MARTPIKVRIVEPAKPALPKLTREEAKQILLTATAEFPDLVRSFCIAFMRDQEQQANAPAVDDCKIYWSQGFASIRAKLPRN